ncbi:5-oxoprolinase/urea amidolyase family protein [Streptomyces tubercidicus]|uniref:5-oxoprolinase/urea amidolyase family protein n=1 Tax=Streptomyces tubercidicus TaxID=47759 RepID=UPI003467E68E
MAGTSESSDGAITDVPEATERPVALEVLEPGVQTTVQDYPGRRGLQAKGFFPAGPVDHFAFRVANRLVGNEPGAAGLEIPMGRFRVRFGFHGVVALTGADGARPTLNGEPMPTWEAVEVSPGDMIACGIAKGPGFRLYLALSGGIDVPEVLGSRATYTMGGIGGLDGRALARGDRLHLAAEGVGRTRRLRLPQSLRPGYANDWEIEVMRGPHADPGFLTQQDWRDFCSLSWKVDLNSNRVGTRLNAHRFTWARDSGGVAGGHPSNVLDGSYPLGGINTNGDVPVILGPDGPTSGGFTVIATVVHAALWKIGQLRPGRDTIRFREVDFDEAMALTKHVEYALDPAHLEDL